MTEFVSQAEINANTARMADQGQGRFAVSADAQRAILGAYLNTVHATLAAHKLSQAAAGASIKVPAPIFPEVVVTYRKVTKAKRRIAGEDYRGLPGVRFDTHMGRIVKVARNKAGQVYFLLVDDARDGFTSLRLEGVTGFAFKRAEDQEAFMGMARNLGLLA